MRTFFSNRKQDRELARELCSHFSKNISPEQITRNRHLVSVNKTTRVLEQAVEKAKRHQQDTKMGFVRKSLFLNDLRWALQENNYPGDFISIVVEAIALGLSKK
jgi:hypothetical protein